VNGVYSEKDFYKIKAMKPSSEIGKIAQDLILTRLSLLGTKHIFDNHHGLLDKNYRRKINRDFKPYAERLADTTILNKDYQSVIRQYDSPKTFFYLDPPYENSSRDIGEYKDIDLSALRDTLKELKGRFLLSINNSKTIRTLFKDFQITKLKVEYQMKRRTLTELLISNYKR